MKQFIALTLIFTLIFPTYVFAEPPELPPEPRIIGIQKGELAPYTGVLLNSLAAARVFVDKDFSITECQLRIDFAVQNELARVNMLLESSKASMEAMNQRYTEIIKIKDTEILRLSELNNGHKNYSEWWAVGGFVVGAALTVALVFAVAETK
jgi:hypothetical protein